MIRATFELEPAGSAGSLAVEMTTGVAGGPAFVQGRVVDEHGGMAVVDLPEDAFGRNLPVLVAALVAGEATEVAAHTRCRLVDLELPEGWLPGPAFPPVAGIGVGVIVKPSLGLRPAEVAAVVAEAVAGGAVLVKDDEKLADPPWCRLEERVRAVAGVLEPGVVYCANVTGPTASLLGRAARAVELGATGVMVDAFAQGLDAVLALREAGLGVPVLAHRAGSGPWVRNDRFGVSGAVIARLTRLAGADYVIVGAFGAKMFDTEADVAAQLHAVRGPLAGARAATALVGGGIGPGDVAAQARTAGGTGLVMLLGSRAYDHPGGVSEAVRAARAVLA